MYVSRKRGFAPWLAASAVVLVGFWLLYALGDVLTPFIVAAVLAYILHPLVEWLEKHRFGRGAASMLVMLFALLVLLALLLVMIPMLFTQFQNLTAKLPALIDFVQNRALPWLTVQLGEGIVPDRAQVTAWLTGHIGTIQTALTNFAKVVVNQSGSLAGTLSNIALLPLLLYYFLLDWERWAGGLRKMIPRRFVDTYVRISTE
ncbi:MAG: AI-2E family transporter, partial [Neisseria sp.]|nr:AI-2E family transporter [Neisseria sp.]